MSNQSAKADRGKLRLSLVPPQGFVTEWEQVTMALRGKFA